MIVRGWLVLLLLVVAGLTFLLLHRGRSLPWQAAASARMRRCWIYVAMVAVYLAIVARLLIRQWWRF